MHNIFRIQDDSIMWGFYCIVFKEYIITGKTLLDFTNLFSPNDYSKNDKIIFKYFKDKYGNRKGLAFKVKKKKIDKIWNFLLDVIRHNDLMSEKHKKVCRALNYFEHSVVVSAVSGCFNFCICFISWYSCECYEFCSKIKDICDNCRN